MPGNFIKSLAHLSPVQTKQNSRGCITAINKEREREREKKNKGTTINGGNGDNGRWDKQAGKQWSLEMKDGGGQRRGPRSGGRWKSGGGLEEWITRDKEP